VKATGPPAKLRPVPSNSTLAPVGYGVNTIGALAVPKNENNEKFEKKKENKRNNQINKR
jgi:hypothetical protein